MLKIYLLGPLRVENSEQAIDPQQWARPKDQDLLKILAFERGHTISQDYLVEALWPNLNMTSAVNSLHVSVSRLRKLLVTAPFPSLNSRLSSNLSSHPFIRHDKTGYALIAGASIWVDLEEFHFLIKQARLALKQHDWPTAVNSYREAEILYRGDLFEENTYEEWALRPREFCRETYLALLEELAESLYKLGLFREVIQVCEKGLAKEPAREALYAKLIQAHSSSGHLAEALQTYSRCSKELASELGVDPGPAVQAAYDAAIKGETIRSVNHSGEQEVISTQSSVIKISKSQVATYPAKPAGDNDFKLSYTGREKELAQLTTCLKEVELRRGQLALVHGEPGIGKSRLLEEFSKLAEAQGILVLTARCYEMESDLPYAALAEVLDRFLAHHPALAISLPSLNLWGPQLVTIIPALFNLELPGLAPHQPLKAEAERAALLAGLTQLLVELSQPTGLLLILDDLQWADPSTLQWLHYLVRRLEGRKILIIGAYRTGEVSFEHPLQNLLHVLAGTPATPHLIELNCLTLDEIRTLFPVVSDSAERGELLAKRLYRETEGHPLFLFETIRTLLETSMVRFDEQKGWEETARQELAKEVMGQGEARLPLPPSLGEAILWRLKRLNEPERRLLYAASITGRGFKPALLAKMTGLAFEDTLDGLDNLVRRQLIQPTPQGKGFVFRHDLIQEAIYSNLNPDRCRSLHGKAAEAFETLASERSPDLQEEVTFELAYHWRLAGKPLPAFHYALLAGDQARNAYAPQEALAHYLRAAKMHQDRPELFEKEKQVQLYERLGKACSELGRFDEAVTHFHSLLYLAKELGEPLQEGKALVALADAYFWRHDFEQARAMAGQAERLAQRLDNPALLAGTLISSANVAMAQGRTTEAKQSCQAVLALTGGQPSRKGNEEPVLGAARLNALGWLGLLNELQGVHTQAIPAFEAALKLGDQLHNPFLNGRSRFGLGMSLGNRGKYEESLLTLREAFKLAQEGGDRYFLPRLPNTIGWVYSQLGDFQQARDWNERSIKIARETGWLEAEANARVNLGQDALQLGRFEQAHKEFELAANLIDRDQWFTWRYRIRLLTDLAELAFCEDNFSEAINYADQALSLASTTEARKHAGRAYLTQGRVWLAQEGPTELPLGAIGQAYQLAKLIENPPLLWQSCAVLCRYYSKLGREAEAMTYKNELIQSIEKVADNLKDSSLRRLFLDSPAVLSSLEGAEGL